MTRVKEGLEGLQGVVRVEFMAHPDSFLVETTGDRPTGDELVRTVQGRVVVPWIREVLGKLGGCTR